MQSRRCNLTGYVAPPPPETQVVLDSGARVFLHLSVHAAFICGQPAAFNTCSRHLGQDPSRCTGSALRLPPCGARSCGRCRRCRFCALTRDGNPPLSSVESFGGDRTRQSAVSRNPAVSLCASHLCQALSILSPRYRVRYLLQEFFLLQCAYRRAGGETQEHGGKDPQMQVRILARSTNLLIPLKAFRLADFLPLE